MKRAALRLTSVLFACLLATQASAVDVTELSSAPPEVMERLINEILPDDSPALNRAFGLSASGGLSVVNSRETRPGRRVSRYVQTYRGIPLWGKHLIITRDKNGAVRRLGGTLVRGISAEIGQPNPGIGRTAMVDRLRAKVASTYVGGSPVFEREKGELVIYIDSHERARLAYEVEFLADIDGGGEPSRPIFVVDANTGEVLETYDALAHQAVVGDCSVECSLLQASDLSGRSGRGRKSGEWNYYVVPIPSEVPAGSTLTAAISGGSGDADLFTRLGAAPSSNQYDCRPYLTGNNESCSHAVNAGEVWHVGVYAYQTYSGVSLNVSVKAPVVTQELGQGPGGNEKVGLYYYDYDLPALTLEQGSNNSCVMNNQNVKTVDLNNGTSGSSAFVYGTWLDCYNDHDAVNGGYSPLNDAHYFGQIVFDMYDEWLGVPPLTFQLTMRVHYGTNYENAFWNGSAMTFGDGANTFYPLVSLDVSAHEVSHGFTDQNSDLIYSDQSGGINEAFSDISGEAAEFYMTGAADFLVGASIFKGSGALRYMANPPLDGRSIGHVQDYSTGMDVHYSSGVFNKAFYRLATASGWSVDKAFRVFAWANQNFWTPSTNFQQGAEGVLQATVDAHSDTSAGSTTAGQYEPLAVIEAFDAVGISLFLPEAPPAPVLEITAFSHNSVELAWNDVSNESGYQIMRDNSLLATVPAGTTGYVDSTVTPQTSYVYSVVAYNDTDSNESNTETVETPSEPPPSAVGLNVALYKIKGVNHADLTVTGTDTYNVYVNAGTEAIASGQTGVYTDNTLQKGGMSRTYKVCASSDTTQCSETQTAQW